MQIQQEVLIEAPASAAWAVLGERFSQVSEWAAPILSSCGVGDIELGIGTVRVCHIAGFGPVGRGVIKERLLDFRPEQMSLMYEAIEGLPRFIRRALNRWSVHVRSDRQCAVRSDATLDLRGAVRLLGPVLAWRFRGQGARVLEELKHRVETGRPHPRKVTAAARARQAP